MEDNHRKRRGLMKKIYLDNASSVPVLKENIDIINNHLSCWHNPNGLYNDSINNRSVIDMSRQGIMKCIGGNIGDRFLFLFFGSAAKNMGIVVLILPILYLP